MADQKSRRSVLPNGELIDALRKKKGWTLEDFADGARFASRTAQKAIAGLPVDIDTLAAIAERLEVAFESLLITSDEAQPNTTIKGGTEITGDGFVLKLQIDLNISKDAAGQSSQLAALINMLEKLLPDSQNIKVVGIVGTTAVISVALTPANLLALGTASLEDAGCTIHRVITPEHYEIDGAYLYITDKEIEDYWIANRSFVFSYEDDTKRALSPPEALVWRLDLHKPSQSTADWVHRRYNSRVLDDIKRRVALWQRRRGSSTTTAGPPSGTTSSTGITKGSSASPVR